MTTLNLPLESHHQTNQHRRKRNLLEFLRPLDQLEKHSASLLARHFGEVSAPGERWQMPRFLHIGPQGGDDPIRLGIFAGINGDEPEGAYALAEFIRTLEITPEASRGYCLFIYPVCNPSGFEDGTRLSRNGHSLNQQFWKNPNAEEVILLQRELVAHAFNGIITLGSDPNSSGIYGSVRGATLSRNLLEPALTAAEAVLPRDHRARIQDFSANRGIVQNRESGILSGPGSNHPRPFEIILETPRSAPQYQQQTALLVALLTILSEYRKMIAFAANI